MQAGNKAVVTGNLVALGELWNRHDLPLNLLQLPWQWPHADDRLQLIAEAFRIDLHRVAPEHAALFQTPQPLGHARR